jgi:hypothetical protein
MPVTPAEAEEDFAAAGFAMLEDFPGGAITPVRVRCKECGLEGSKRLNDIRSGRGCPGCAGYGFDPDAPALVYLMRNPELRAVKIGITNDSADGTRIAQHQRHGWMTLAIHRLRHGAEAIALERSILTLWRDELGLAPCVHPSDMPQGGWTETAPEGVLSETLAALAGFRERAGVRA